MSTHETRLKMLRLLDEEPMLSQRDIARRLGVSLGSANYCMRALIEKGWVKVNNFRRSDNKLGYTYILTPSGVTERAIQTKYFLKRKLEEYEQLKVEIASLQAELTSRGNFKEDQS